jgi:hypothetical protein
MSASGKRCVTGLCREDRPERLNFRAIDAGPPPVAGDRGFSET